MSTSGKAVVRASGKRGVLTGGKAAVFNADGDCPECCPECPFCKKAGTIEYQMVLSGLTFLCVEKRQKMNDGGELNGTHDLLWLGFNTLYSEACAWGYETDVNINTYESDGCVGGVVGYTVMHVYVHLVYNGEGDWHLYINDNGFIILFANDLEMPTNSCADELIFTNDDIGWWTSGGTATVNLK